LGTVIGAVLGAGVLYLIGGTVVLVRLHQANLPVEQGLDVIPREKLLLIGAREVIIVLAVSTALLLLLKLKRRFLAFVLLIGAALLFVPLTPAGIAWPVVLLIVLLMWLILEQQSKTRWALLVIPILVLVAVVFRYNDPPSRFSEGNVWTNDPQNMVCRSILLGRKQTEIYASQCGAFLSIKDDYVYLANAGTGSSDSPPEVWSVPKASVKRLILTDHVDPRAPRVSIIGRLTRFMGVSTISCNPLECWIGHRNVGSRIFG